MERRQRGLAGLGSGRRQPLQHAVAQGEGRALGPRPAPGVAAVGQSRTGHGRHGGRGDRRRHAPDLASRGRSLERGRGDPLRAGGGRRLRCRLWGEAAGRARRGRPTGRLVRCAWLWPSSPQTPGRASRGTTATCSSAAQSASSSRTRSARSTLEPAQPVSINGRARRQPVGRGGCRKHVNVTAAARKRQSRRQWPRQRRSAPPRPPHPWQFSPADGGAAIADRSSPRSRC